MEAISRGNIIYTIPIDNDEIYEIYVKRVGFIIKYYNKYKLIEELINISRIWRNHVLLNMDYSDEIINKLKNL